MVSSPLLPCIPWPGPKRSRGQRRRAGPSRSALALRSLIIAFVATTIDVAAPTCGFATTQVLFDFEGPYLVDPGRTIKDHALFAHQGKWYCFYIRGVQGVSGTASENEIGRASSADFRTWSLLGPAIEAGPDAWDDRNVWAPVVIPTPGATQQWTMFYTGANSSIVQRLGRAITSNPSLAGWSKYGANPVLEPDPQLYYWAEDLNFSAFRDPFYFQLDGQHHLLHTVHLPDASIPAGRRAAVHHATSSDLVNWTDVGVLATHNGPSNVAWREIESVQLHPYGGFWHMFYTEAGSLGVRHIRSTEMDGGWDFNAFTQIDNGIAAELTPLGGESFLFTRHAAARHTPEHSTEANEIFYVLRVDTLRFDPSTAQPSVALSDGLGPDWPVRSGTAFFAAPTFGDNPVERGEPGSGLVGHGYLSSREFYAGPLSGIGSPGAEIGGGGTGSALSRVFSLSADELHLRVGGGADSTCTVSVIEEPGGELLFQELAGDRPTMEEVHWIIPSEHRGKDVRLLVEDPSTDPEGWIAIDRVELVVTASNSPSAPRQPRLGKLLPNRPNPFNPRTVLGYELSRDGHAELSVFDARGRRVILLFEGWRSSGAHTITWSGRDEGGLPVASGVYHVRLVMDGVAQDWRSITLVR